MKASLAPTVFASLICLGMWVGMFRLFKPFMGELLGKWLASLLTFVLWLYFEIFLIGAIPSGWP